MPNVKLPPATSDRLCECGCGQFTPIARVSDRSKGWVRGEGVRFLRGHGVRLANRERSAAARSWVVDEATGCWLWQGKLGPQGYGRCERVYAHKWVFQQRVGPVPEGHELHHTCENKVCVNPAHLQAVTRLEHKQLHSVLRFQRGEQDHCTVLGIPDPNNRKRTTLPKKPFVCPRADCDWEGADRQYEAPCPVHGRNLVPRRS